MSFYISLSGLKAAQTDLGVIANNVANVSSVAFKKSSAQFGDIFAATGGPAGGNGVRLVGVQQQFTQGTLETTDKTLDLAVTGEGFFTVKGAGNGPVSYTRAGAFGVDKNRNVIDSTGAHLQVLPTDATGLPTGTAASDLTDLVIPTDNGATPPVQLSAISISETGLVAATYADGSVKNLGVVAMASFPAQDELRQQGDAHWIASGESGAAVYGGGNSGMFGAVRSGTLERSNVDITEELVALISAQRNYQANAKAIETATTMTQTITNMRT
ncbi:flagellar hook-basal body complex protein [Sphingobium nicotianae]|uniref:Flagellar hook protein FlgE n=1 Tax=Sphingobium nicotianae TaxID=2782607 RepID=A0A9X1DBV2_9SPHN|nr:flagellar hook-basal body complex protein [Sphingobium nicotianae]MBT2187073.1 flagellar hook-basal body complex protein [Sphingobium nicotianae]